MQAKSRQFKSAPTWYYHVSQPASHHLTRNGQTPRLDPYMFEYALYLTTANTIIIVITITKIIITTSIIINVIMTNHLTTIALESAITARDSLNTMYYHQICLLHQASLS